MNRQEFFVKSTLFSNNRCEWQQIKSKQVLYVHNHCTTLAWLTRKCLILIRLSKTNNGSIRFGEGAGSIFMNFPKHEYTNSIIIILWKKIEHLYFQAIFFSRNHVSVNLKIYEIWLLGIKSTLFKLVSKHVQVSEGKQLGVLKMWHIPH